MGSIAGRATEPWQRFGKKLSSGNLQRTADYQLSSKAVEDIASTADYTIETFGLEQARRYRNGIEQTLQRRADSPLIGKNADRHPMTDNG